MRPDYVARRFLIFLIIVWIAATINFVLPRLSTENPVREQLMKQAMATGYFQPGFEDVVKEYEQKFGLDKPLWQQYLIYVGDIARLDLNYSITNYPKSVTQLIGDGLPWTVGLMGTTTLLSCLLGTLVGALMGWPRAPRFIGTLLFPPLLTLSAIPFYLMGLLLLYFFAFQVRWFPIMGGYSLGVIPDWRSLSQWMDVLRHAVLPASCIVVTSIGFWALSMRGMMVTIQGEDYVTLADAKGLRASTIFLRYFVRNALLPQVTSLGLSLGQIISGAILVEIVFAYPGLGTVLFRAIKESDYFVIQGLVLLVIGAVAFITFLLDLLYPMLDPRITYGGS